MQVSANSPSQPALQRRRPPAAHDTQEIPANTQAGPVRVRDLRETHAAHLNRRYSDAGRQRRTTRKKYPQTHRQGQFVCETCGKLMQRYSDAGRQRHTTRKKYPQTHKQGQFVCETCGKLMQVSANSPSQPALQRRRPPAAHDTQKIPANTQAGPVRVRDLRETHAAHLNRRYSDAGRQRRTTRKKYPQTHRQGQFVCETCGKLMQNATALRTHQRSHLDIKPFACNECPKSFTLKTSLQWHMRSHTGEKPYQCTECPLAFSLKGNLDRHHKTAHLGMRQSVPCPICGRIFTTNSCVRVHIKTVHHGQPGPKRDRRKRSKFGKELLDNK
ncbi:oocyte zinc finger protein XlCOF6-like [Cydia fagiglandana]|uniref:oocyte zinc finger protein XlCOF6-like n=1 Tax=Cydia fagiglandana TaxID=1458189 RepID=UPI002FEE6490